MDITMQGGVQKGPTSVRESVSGYPDAWAFENPLPSYEFYVRYADNIKLENIKITPISKDLRPIIYKDKEITNLIFN